MVAEPASDGLRAFVRARDLAWPHFPDADRTLQDRFLVYGLPDPILIGPDGVIRARGDALRGDRLHATLRRVLDDAR